MKKLFLHVLLVAFSSLLFAMESEERAFMIVHGFGSGIFECTELKTFIEKQCLTCVVELVPLGQHETTKTLRASSWQQWGEPMASAYNTLRDRFDDVTVVFSSAAAAVFLAQASETENVWTKQGRAPRKVVLIDPFIVPRSSLLWLAPYLQYVPSLFNRKKENLTEEEEKYSHEIQPIEALAQLQYLRCIVDGHLKNGINLPRETTVHILHSDQDPLIDDNSASYLAQHINAGKVLRTPFASTLHVFTRLRGRASTTVQDVRNQMNAFSLIMAKGQ